MCAYSVTSDLPRSGSIGSKLGIVEYRPGTDDRVKMQNAACFAGHPEILVYGFRGSAERTLVCIKHRDATQTRGVKPKRP